MQLEFFRHIFEKSSNIELTKIRPVWAELLHADGRTDGRSDNMAKLMAAFRNFANAPSNILNFLKSPFLQTLCLCVNLSLYVG